MENLETGVLDSGERREFSSGAVRDIQKGKGRCDLLPLDVVAYLLNMARNDDYAIVVSGIDMFVNDGQCDHLYYALQTFYELRGWDFSTMALEVSKHFEDGAVKYGDNNWRKGIDVNCYIDSAMRHFFKFLRGDTDEHHDRAVAWNIMCAIWTCTNHPELNQYRRSGV